MGGNGGPDWRALMAGEDAAAIEQLSRFKTPADFLKSHNELRTKLSQRPANVSEIGENSTPEQIAEYRKAFDIPDVAQDAKDIDYATAYGIQAPDGYEMDSVEQAMLGQFAKAMNASHVPKRHVAKAVEQHFKIQAALKAQNERIDVEKRRDWTNALRDELGSKEYEAQRDSAAQWLKDQFRGNEDGFHRLLAYRAPDGGMLGDDPFFFKLFAQQAMGAGYTDRITANSLESGGKSLAEQQREIERLMFTDKVAYDEASKPNGRLDKILAARMARGELDENGNERRQRRTG